MTRKLLITGGAGFIGSNFVRMAAAFPDVEIINLDALTYAGNPENLKDLEDKRNYMFIKGFIQNEDLVDKILSENEISCIMNFAAESHVDRSIINSSPFFNTNVLGTMVLADAARKYQIPRFIQISTDEVYGSLGNTGKFTETTPISPNSPYSASKASADLLIQSYVHTFDFPAIITRCSNNYGPYQFPEKLIPLMVLNAIENKKLPVYGDGMNIRDWIHVSDHCNAIWTVYLYGKAGEVYNIGGNCEKANIEIVMYILEYLQKPKSLIEYVKDRPGHDRRYAMDSSKIESALGWMPKIDFTEGIINTINWYLNNSEWCANVRSGAYMEYYKEQYNIEL